MKKLFLMLVVIVIATTTTFAQNSGLGFNYQAVVRKADGMLLSNSDVTLRISLYPGQMATSPTWVETHKVQTDVSGCFGITVGKGTRDNSSVAANYKDVNFAAVYYWMKIELLEGSAYREVSFSQLPSSPYSEVAYNAVMPAGMIVPFAGPVENIPAGWLLCNGSAISRSNFMNLYKAIGLCWGEGDGSTTFNLPDLCGMFLRGVSGESGNDEDAENRGMLNENGSNIGNNVGSYQGDAIRNITGQIGGFDAYSVIAGNTWGAFYAISGKYKGNKENDYDNAVVGFDASRVVPTGADNRPKNVYVNYIIKY